STCDIAHLRSDHMGVQSSCPGWSPLPTRPLPRRAVESCARGPRKQVGTSFQKGAADGPERPPNGYPPDMKIAVIIPAAGSGSRFRSDAPEDYSDAAAGFSGRSKLDEDLGGRPVLQRAVELFNKRDEVGAIVV